MNAPGANTVSAAEHAMGLLLAQARHIPWRRRRCAAANGIASGSRGPSSAQDIGIVGLGASAATSRSSPRVRDAVVGHDPYLSPERAAELQLKLLPLDQLLGQADVVTLHVAHTEQTIT